MENYNHGEAFMHMMYQSESGKKITIWNSRDGVTPFMVIIDGEEYQHKQWIKDNREIDFKPGPGDYIFRTVTREDLLVSLMKYVNRLMVEAQDHSWIKKNILERPAEWIEEEIAKQITDGEPHLECIPEVELKTLPGPEFPIAP